VALGLIFLTAPRLVTSAVPPMLTRGPYLQLLTTDAVTVVWNTDAAAACALEIRPVAGSPAIIAGATGTVCAIAVNGLTPGTQYAYRPLADGTPLRSESTFRTDGAFLPFSFLVLGDSGTGGSKQADVRDAMLATPADFILHTGDMVYPEGATEDYNPKFFAPYADLIREIMFWPTIGDNDTFSIDGVAPWREAFYTPANNASGIEDYYSFDFGNAHVTVIDTTADTDPGSPQYTFLDQDLASSAAQWKFTVFHDSI
jgi:phosphodiesterase/alkaline phosphatase D-like protein